MSRNFINHIVHHLQDFFHTIIIVQKARRVNQNTFMNPALHPISVLAAIHVERYSALRHAGSSGKPRRGGFRKKLPGIIIFLVIVLAGQWFFRENLIFPVRVPDLRLSPQIEKNQILFFTYPPWRSPGRDDIVLIKPKEARPQILCKIAAVQGDKLQFRENTITRVDLKGHSVPLWKTRFEGLSLRLPETEVEVRPGMVFCLHPNLNYPGDSRQWGLFPMTEISAVKMNSFLF